MTPRLKEKYKNEIVKNLMSKLNQKNIYSIPRIKKIVINMGLGPDGSDQKILKSCIHDISAITGQYPIVTKFKKSISNFKSRKGTNAGLKVTLRNDRMFEFLDRLVNIALPRIKDFRGLSENGCDNFGNYSFGIKEHIIFPEINFDKVEKIRGMDVTIVTNSNSSEKTIILLKEFNLPIVKGTKKKLKKTKKVVEKEEKTEEKK
tara:strand:+ start:5514 stop:6125 length:612 start_codon:yes stop_codon:yes gene_type:complete